MPGTSAPARLQCIPTATVGDIEDIVSLCLDRFNAADQLFFAIRKLTPRFTVEHDLAGIGMELLGHAETQIVEMAKAAGIEVPSGG